MMNTRSECREAALNGEPLFVSINRGEHNILFRYMIGTAYVILLATAEESQSDVCVPVSFVEALGLPPYESSHPLIVVKDLFQQWYTVRSVADASLIEWLDKKEIAGAEEMFKDVLIGDKDGQRDFNITKLVAP